MDSLVQDTHEINYVPKSTHEINHTSQNNQIMKTPNTYHSNHTSSKKPIPQDVTYKGIKFKYKENTAYLNEDLRDQTTESYLPKNLEYSDIYNDKLKLKQFLDNSQLLVIWNVF